MKKMMINLGAIANYDEIKDKLFVKVCSAENVNPNYYYNEKCGFCETYHILIDNNGVSISSVPVTHAIVKAWGCSAANLRKDAIENSKKLFPVNIFSLNNIFGFEDDETKPYVLTTENGCFGAAAMVYPGALTSLCDTLGTDSLIILPSSIHEVIVLPFTKEMAGKNLDSMIQLINASVVEDDEVLDDKAYFYNKDMDGLTYLSDYLDVFKD